MTIDLNDIRETSIIDIRQGNFRLVNGAIGLEAVVDAKELAEIMSNTSEFVYELAYIIKDRIIA